MRLPSSKDTRGLKREGGQREESAREEKTESRPVLNISSGRGIHKQAISSGEKPLKPGPAANEVPPAKHTAPVESSEPRVDLKDDSVSHIALPGVPRGQSAITEPKSGEKPTQEPTAGNTSAGERKGMDSITPSTRNKAGEQIKITEVPNQVQPKNTAPVKSLEPSVSWKSYSVSYTVPPGAPRGQSAITESKNGEKPTHESSPGNASPAGEKNDPARIAEPAQIGKKTEASMDTGPGTEVNQASSEPPAATTDSGETDQEMSQKQKSGLGDLADLFATSASEFTEKNRLAEQVNDVDVNELLREGLGLLGKVKKSNG
jgi:hypothetical protein